jgi:hypothetical protein
MELNGVKKVSGLMPQPRQKPCSTSMEKNWTPHRGNTEMIEHPMYCPDGGTHILYFPTFYKAFAALRHLGCATFLTPFNSI